ncbi:hypothetical protein GLOIN_2v1617537 [Rhizophagus irregularis DAOM 181602=DAOM 197198]|nr:hypothetical protein GLOIN_2v1617537 [Rhizophagus irregularis DAOM 181602=DAOM 197198]
MNLSRKMDKTFKFGEWTVKKVYRMFLLGAFRFPISWEDHHELLHALPILWNFGNLKKPHNCNSIISKKSELKTYICHINNLPKSLLAKKRVISIQ